MVQGPYDEVENATETDPHNQVFDNHPTQTPTLPDPWIGDAVSF